MPCWQGLFPRRMSGLRQLLSCSFHWMSFRYPHIRPLCGACRPKWLSSGKCCLSETHPIFRTSASVPTGPLLCFQGKNSFGNRGLTTILCLRIHIRMNRHPDVRVKLTVSLLLLRNIRLWDCSILLSIQRWVSFRGRSIHLPQEALPWGNPSLKQKSAVPAGDVLQRTICQGFDGNFPARIAYIAFQAISKSCLSSFPRTRTS